MSVITKAVAEKVSKKLVEKKDISIQKIKNELGTLAHRYFMQHVAMPVQDFHKKYPGYFRTEKYLYLNGNGFNSVKIEFPQGLSIITTSGGSAYYSPTKTEADKLVKLTNKLETEKQNRDRLRLDIENALLSLRTYKRIKEQFPDAIPFLPEPNSVALVVNVDDIRNRLKS